MHGCSDCDGRGCDQRGGLGDGQRRQHQLDHHAVSIDTIKPTIVGSADRAPDQGDWYRNDVTVSFTCADTNGSGVAGCSDATVLQEGAGQSVTGHAADAAGNAASATVSGINIDKTAPTTTSDAPSGWQRTHVTVKFAAVDQDGLSGVANRESNPTIHGAPDRGPDRNGWYNADVTVNFTCDDTGGSGVASCPQSRLLSDDGAGQSVTGEAADVAGNTASTTVSGIDIDKTAPSTTSDAPSGEQTS